MIRENKKTSPAIEKQRGFKDIQQMLKKDFIKNKTLYLMAVPIIIYLIVFKYIPMYGVMMAFENYSPKLGILGSKWVGLKNFKAFFESASFWQVFLNTIRISSATLVCSFPCPIILALLMNELKSIKYAKVIQNLTYIPHFISLVVVCGLIHTFVAPTGIIGGFFCKYLGIKGSLLVHPQYFLPIYIISNIWQKMGWDSIIYLSALTGIDQTLYEAAEVDGAGRWKKALHITFPGILPVIITMLILKVGGIVSVGFEKILLLYNDATMDVADVISTYTYRRGIINMDYSYSTAVGLFNSVINIIFLLVTQHISKKGSGYGLW